MEISEDRDLYTAELVLEGNLPSNTFSPNAIKSVPRWHFEMLNDHNRNISFANAINSLDLTDKIVLDIGTGTGLLAMIAAKNNAKHVYTVEVNPYIAKTAQQIIKDNKLQDKITVINKLSTDLIPGVDLPKNIDILISETVDCGFFGEGFVPALQHAKQELLAPDAILLPCAVKLTAALLSSDDVRNLNYVATSLDFDVSLFNIFSTQGYFPVRLNSWETSLVSDEVIFYQRDFVKPDSFDENSRIDFTATQDATVDGIVFWFELDLVESQPPVTNNPAHKKNHWMQSVQIFEHAQTVSKGERFSVNYKTGTLTIDFSPANMLKHN